MRSGSPARRWQAAKRQGALLATWAHHKSARLRYEPVACNAITRLVERKLIKPQTGDGRQRPYRLTPQGSALLTERLNDMRRIALIGLGRLRTA